MKARARASIDWALVLRDQIEAADRITPLFAISDRVKQTEALRKFAAQAKARSTGVAPLISFLNEYLSWLPHAWIREARSRGLSWSAIDLSTGGYAAVLDAISRAEQYERNLLAAVALARFKLAEGRYPAKLTELVPKYLPAVPDDIFTGKPVIYRRTDDGYLLYAVGNNGKDDGGKTYGDAEGADDVRIRIPVPKKPK